MFTRTVVLTTILPPSEVGALVVSTLILAYSQFVDLGATSAMEARIPVASHESPDKYRMLVRAGFASKFIASTTVGTLLIASVIFLPSSNHDLVLAIAIAGASFPLSGTFNTQQAIFRATRNYKSLGTSIVISAGSNLLFGVAGALTFGLLGALVGQVASLALAVGYAARIGAVPKPLFKRSTIRMRSLVWFGWPLAVLALAQYNLVYIDQVLVLKLLEAADVAAYNLAISFGTILYCIPIAIAGAFAPRSISSHAEGDARSFAEHVWRPAEALRIGMPALTGLVGLLAIIAYNTILGHYRAAAAEPTLLYLAAIYFLSVNLPPNAALVPLRQHAKNVPIIVSVIAANFGIGWILVARFGLELRGVAYASIASYALYLIVHIGFVSYQFERSALRSARTVAHFVAPGAIMTLYIVISISLMGPTLVSALLIACAGIMQSIVQYGLSRRLTNYPYAETGRIA